jgi:hypothetical protein
MRGEIMKWWERRALLEHLVKREAFGPLLDETFKEYGKSLRLVKHSQTFEKWTLGEIDSKAAIRYFKGRLISESDSGIKGRLQEYINFITGQETEDNKKATSRDEHREEPEEKRIRQTGAVMENEPPDSETEIENHILMRRLKDESNMTYQAMKEALKTKEITFKDGLFDFNFDRGCVGLFFREGGFTEYKTLKMYVLIKGKPPAGTTLENCTKNTPPKSWEKIKRRYYDTTTK